MNPLRSTLVLLALSMVSAASQAGVLPDNTLLKDVPDGAIIEFVKPDEIRSFSQEDGTYSTLIPGKSRSRIHAVQTYTFNSTEGFPIRIPEGQKLQLLQPLSSEAFLAWHLTFANDPERVFSILTIFCQQETGLLALWTKEECPKATDLTIGMLRQAMGWRIWIKTQD